MSRWTKLLSLLGLTLIVVLLAHRPVLSQSSEALGSAPSLLLFASLGLVGSGHCIGMCGPFVMGYSQAKNNHWSSHVLYGLGRSTTYGFMGLVVGLFGQFLQSFMGFRSVLLVLAGLLMIYLALAQLKLWRLTLPSIQGWSTYQRLVQTLFAQSRWYRTYPLGVVLGFIPCGLTAIALSFAVTQSPGIAMGGMFLFGLGTMPAMVGLGLLIQRLKFPRLQRYIAILMALFGVLTFWLGSYRLGWMPPPPQMALLHHLHPTPAGFPEAPGHHDHHHHH